MRRSRPCSAALLLWIAACSPADAPADPAAALPAQSPPTAVGFDGPERPVAARVFIVGIDGAGWSVLDPLMAAGTLPNLARLVASGSRGVLRSMEPTASAILWTTLATGRTPEQHGIRGFVATSASGRETPVTSNLRRTRALWNIASDAGVTVGFLGWWVTWPAEAVRGFMASDYTWPLRKDRRGFATGVDPELDVPHRTYPPELIRELEPFNRIEAALEPGALRELGVDAVPAVDGYAVRDMLLKDVSLGEMAPHLLGRFDPSLFAVYFDGYDAFCHLFWPAVRRSVLGRPGEPGPTGRQRALGRALRLHLARIDDTLGAVMRHAGPEGVVLVISDHGYGDNPGRRPVLRAEGEQIRPPHWHTLDGIIAAAGAPIRRGASLEGAGVLDVAPTVLALLGLPVAEDMEGRVLTDLFTERFAAEHPVRRIASYETAPRGDAAPLESPYDAQVIERLRTLGYLD